MLSLLRLPVLCLCAVLSACSSSPAAAPAAEAVPEDNGPCPARMALIEGRVCIDRYENKIVDGRAVPAIGEVPARETSYTMAHDACRAAGLRLCSSEEWTLACAGPRERKYPYGDEYEKGRCNTAEWDTELESMAPAAGGSHERCVTPEGVFDLSGNLWEWTATPDTGPLREMRGGGFSNSPRETACVRDHVLSQPIEGAFDGLGIRCCRDPR